MTPGQSYFCTSLRAAKSEHHCAFIIIVPYDITYERVPFDFYPSRLVYIFKCTVFWRYMTMMVRCKTHKCKSKKVSTSVTSEYKKIKRSNQPYVLVQKGVFPSFLKVNIVHDCINAFRQKWREKISPKISKTHAGKRKKEK